MRRINSLSLCGLLAAVATSLFQTSLVSTGADPPLQHVSRL